MNPQIKEKWIAALRSGEYTQGTGSLRTPIDHYCCLGVLCDLYSKEQEDLWKYDEDNMSYVFDSENDYLPKIVRDWVGLSDIDPVIDYDGDIQFSLSQLNDEGHTFKQIATIIEEQL